jgi:hypothetical protein
MSDYLRASSARDLIEAICPDLAFAGIPTNFKSPPDEAQDALDEVIEHLLTTVGAA